MYISKRRDEFDSSDRQGCIYRYFLPFTVDLNTTRVYYDLWWNVSIVRTFPQKRVWKSFFHPCFRSICRDEPRRKFRVNLTTDVSNIVPVRCFSFFSLSKVSYGTFPGALLRSATCRSMELTLGMNTIPPLPYLYIRKNFRGATGFGLTEQRK